jgi:hypothetical protein
VLSDSCLIAMDPTFTPPRYATPPAPQINGGAWPSPMATMAFVNSS